MLALIAWKMVEPSGGGTKDELAKLLEQTRTAEREKTQKDTLDAVLKDIKGTKEGYVNSLQREKQNAADLNKELTIAKEIAALREKGRDSALDDLAAMKEEKEGLAADLEKVKASREKLKDQVASLEKQLRPEQTDKTAGDEKAGGPSRTTLMVLAGCIAVLAVAGGLTAMMQSRNANSDDQPPEGDVPEKEIVATKIRPPSAAPPPAAADEVVNSLVGDPPVDAPISRGKE